MASIRIQFEIAENGNVKIWKKGVTPKKAYTDIDLSKLPGLKYSEEHMSLEPPLTSIENKNPKMIDPTDI